MQDVTITFWKDEKGIHVLHNEDGIGLHFTDMDGVQDFLNETGGGKYDLIFREFLKMQKGVDSSLTTKVTAKSFTYLPAKIEAK